MIYVSIPPKPSSEARKTTAKVEPRISIFTRASGPQRRPSRRSCRYRGGGGGGEWHGGGGGWLEIGRGAKQKIAEICLAPIWKPSKRGSHMKDPVITTQKRTSSGDSLCSLHDLGPDGAPNILRAGNSNALSHMTWDVKHTPIEQNMSCFSWQRKNDIGPLIVQASLTLTINMTCMWSALPRWLPQGRPPILETKQSTKGVSQDKGTPTNTRCPFGSLSGSVSARSLDTQNHIMWNLEAQALSCQGVMCHSMSAYTFMAFGPLK